MLYNVAEVHVFVQALHFNVNIWRKKKSQQLRLLIQLAWKKL